MNQNAALRIAMAQDQLAADPDYQKLTEEYRALSGAMSRLLERLPEEDGNLVTDYMGLCWEMHRRMLETACLTEKGKH